MTELRIDHEQMSNVFAKYHLRGPWPFDPVFHHFNDIDRGDPHDHPFGFRSVIIFGGYRERIFAQDGSSVLVNRLPGESFKISATHIHRIEELFEDECWTMILPGPWERKSRFWQFREDGAYSRAWDEEEWRK